MVEDWPFLTNEELADLGISRGFLRQWRSVYKEEKGGEQLP